MVNAPEQDVNGLESLRSYLADQELALNGRLPAERHLSDELGLSRGKLRKALAVLESEGQVWRHVGRGTFFGPRPVTNLNDIEYLGNHTRPTEVMEARMSIEPQLAKLAAIHGNAANYSELRRCIKNSKKAQDWRVFESWDNNFHQAIATATCNKLLISLFDTLNIVRRSTVWGQLRSTNLPPADHKSFAEHDAIYEAIVARDPELAAEEMRGHLKTVRERTYAAMEV